MTACALFDTDGTLVDISKLVERALAEATHEQIGKKFKFSDLSKEQIAGVHMEKLYSAWMIKNGYSEQDAQKLWHATLQDHYESRLLEFLRSQLVHSHSYRCQGVVRFLKFLEEHSVPCGVFSGALAKVHVATLAATGLASYFEARVSGGEPNAPRVELVERCFIELQRIYPTLTKQQTVVFGDTPSDVNAARQYNVKSAAIRASSRFSFAELAKADPTKIYASFAQYWRIGEELFGIKIR